LSHGQTLGRYTLIEQLAIGGMAEIWLAHMAGPEGFEKVVVIKKIRPHLRGQKNFLNMFLNEARLAAHLNHPNIVQIHEFGKPDDQYYIAMEYIFGRDLSEIVPKAKRANIPFPIEYATKIIAQVCEALYYAHTKADNKGQPLQIASTLLGLSEVARFVDDDEAAWRHLDEAVSVYPHYRSAHLNRLCLASLAQDDGKLEQLLGAMDVLYPTWPQDDALCQGLQRDGELTYLRESRHWPALLGKIQRGEAILCH